MYRVYAEIARLPSFCLTSKMEKKVEALSGENFPAHVLGKV